MYGWKIWLSLPAFLTQLCSLLKVYYGLWTAQCWSIQNRTWKKNTFMNKKGQNTCQIWLYWNSWCNVFVFKGGTFSRVPTALCFCVVWMCCDFQGLIAFHTLWDEGEDSIHCASLTQGQSAFLYYYILYYAEVLGGLPMQTCWHRKKYTSHSFQQTWWQWAHLSPKEFHVILTNNILHTDFSPPIFEIIFYIQDLSSWGSSDQSL